MTFADFSKHLFKIEATPKRLEITDLLVELIRQTDPGEIEKAVNLSLGQLAPLYKDIDFNMAEKMMVKAIAAATNVNVQNVINEFKRNGDLGETALKFKSQSSNLPPASLREALRAGKTKSQSSKLSVSDVFDHLLTIAQDSGENSQERKIDKTAGLLGALDPLSAKYAVRIILGNLRLGFSDRTVLDALSKLIAGDKSARGKLEAVYNVRPDIGWMAKRVQSSEVRGQNFRTEPLLGTPVLPALCQRLEGTEEIVEKMGAVAAEPKWDGQRIQAHAWIRGTRDKGQGLKGKTETEVEVKLFTRGLEDVSIMFPDLVMALKNLLHQPSALSPQPLALILDGEVVAFDPKTNKILPFQTMITRKRKYDIQQQLLNVPIRYMVFDIMYFNGQSLMNKPFSDRRRLLEQLFSPKAKGQGTRDKGQINLSSLSPQPLALSPYISLSLAPQLVSDSPAEIRDFLKAQIDLGLEGIVAKRLGSPYSPGRTGFSWVKLKWEGKAKSGGLVDTIDCVVMGIYAGQGKRAGFGAGAFLVGILSNLSHLSYLTISKIGTGLTDEQWRELRAKGQGLRAKGQPKEYDVPKQLAPDIWIEPKIVVEIQADNITVSPLHTARYALRFPRLVRYRDDKKPEQATTVEEVKGLYKMSLEH